MDDKTMRVVMAAGARQWVRLEAGAILLVRKGRVVLTPPMEWLAECVTRPAHDLAAEASYRAAVTGWAELRAPGAAEVLIVPARSGWRPPRDRLRQLFDRVLGRQPAVE
jgi:hypothetical protein